MENFIFVIHSFGVNFALCHGLVLLYCLILLLDGSKSLYLKALECLFAYCAFLHTILEEETRESFINDRVKKPYFSPLNLL